MLISQNNWKFSFKIVQTILYPQASNILKSFSCFIDSGSYWRFLAPT
ncbi:unnamed protein product, partial [Vitis vinifera]|uniref:Uncharacterized protein n=1 Tax=Vitis vinifera TaxID=29760 RepID=D7U770_VITVI